jgi:hypothetical protein
VPALPGLTEDFEPRTPQNPPSVVPVPDPAAQGAKTADFEANTPQEPQVAHKPLPETTGDFAPHLPKTEAVELPEEPAEVGDEEVMEVGSGEVADPPKKPADDSVPFATPESLELSDLSDPEASPLPSKLDPWFAQVAHGYCPSDAATFTRHTPPTNFPGRDA